MPVPINQRYSETIVLDASGAGAVEITMRSDFLMQRTRWVVTGGTKPVGATTDNVPKANNKIDGVPFEGTDSGNNDQSNSVQLLQSQSSVECEWTGGNPGATATLYLWGVEYPAGTGMASLTGGSGPPSGGSGPGNPILGGNTLIRDAIQSADYIPGVQGWAIFRDGSLDMNGGTFRGEVIVTSTDGSAVLIKPTGGGVIEFEPLDVTGVTKLSNGEIFSSIVNVAGGHYAFMTLSTPRIMDAMGTTSSASIELITRPTNGGVFPGFSVSNDLFEVSADIQVHGVILGNSDMHIQGNGAIDGTLTVPTINTQTILAEASAATSSAAVAAETTVLLIAGFTFQDGLAYAITVGGGAQSTVAGTNADFRIKKSVAGVLGASYGEFYRTPLPAPANSVFGVLGEIQVKNNTGAAITTDVALTLQCAANTVVHSASGQQRYFHIRCIGFASNAAFANAKVVS